MNKKKKESLIAGILFFIAGTMFIISGIIGEEKDVTFISLGCCFITLSIVFGMQYKNNNKNKDNENK